MTRHHSVGKIVLLAMSLGIASGTLAPSAHAQDLLASDADQRHTDLARTLFAEGVALVSEGRFAEAEAKFREALALHDAPSIRANLASALYEQGEYPEAQALAESVTADASAPAVSRESARLLADQIGASAGYVRVTAAETGEVAVDGWLVDEPAEETPMSSGAHVATLSQLGVERARTPFEITTGEHLTVSLAPEEVFAPTPEPPASAPALIETWWFWAAVGGGVVIVALAIGLGIAASAGTTVEPALAGDFEPGVLRW